MGSISNGNTVLENLNKESSSFLKWFEELQPKIFEDFGQSDSESEPEDDEELSLRQKRKNEKVKKYISSFLNADILLELAEDEHRDGNFVCKFSSLEAYSVLGAVSFFHAYLKQAAEADKSIGDVEKFLKKCENVKGVPENYVSAMQSIFKKLKAYHEVQFGRLTTASEPNSINGHGMEKQESAAVMTVKLHFWSGIPEQLWTEREDLSRQIISLDAENWQWNLDHYHIKKCLRLEVKDSSKVTSLNEERKFVEKAFKANAKNPHCVLAACQYFTDFISSDTAADLAFAQEKFETHSDIVKYIRKQSEQVAEEYPSFLRASFAFSDIFARDLPITRQDREYAKSFLDKALKANPTSSKINHKMGMFLIRGRQFSEARKCFEKATESDPQVYYSLIKLLLRDASSNKEYLESYFNAEFANISRDLGDKNELSFWKGCYFFIIGDRDLAGNIWVEIILEFYVTRPEVDLEIILPFKKVPETAKSFLWIRSPLTLDNIKSTVKASSSAEKTRKKVVYQRLYDLIGEAIEE